MKPLNLIIPVLLPLVCWIDFAVDAAVAAKSKLVRLDDNTWTQLLEGEWMVEFFAPWCPACKQLEPQWQTFSGWSDDLSIKVASVDVTSNPGLSGRFMVTALPTIYHVKDGIFRAYKGSRDSNSFLSFVEEKKWEKIDPISSWKHPSSVQMSIVSYFFKISMALRAVHNRLVEEFGIPQWGSYVIFAFATILLGALLGLLLVCMIDFLFPAKVVASESTTNLLSNRSPDDHSGDRRTEDGKKSEEQQEEQPKESKKDS